MKASNFKLLSILASIIVSVVLMTAFIVSARAESDQPQQMQQNWAQHRQTWVKASLAKMAERLEIKASQQGVWQSYAKTIEEAAPVSFDKPDANADAATMARNHANFVAAQAKRLAQIADATAKLQEALTPDQRKTLDQIAHAFQHRHWQHGHHSAHSEGEGHQRMDSR